MNRNPSLPPPRYRVRVWLGGHAIANRTTDQAQAERFAAAMRRRFFGLRVTNELVPGGQHEASS